MASAQCDTLHHTLLYIQTIFNFLKLKSLTGTKCDFSVLQMLFQWPVKKNKKTKNKTKKKDYFLLCRRRHSLSDNDSNLLKWKGTDMQKYVADSFLIPISI